MSKEEDLKAKFWSKLRSHKIMMIGMEGAEDGHARPMTAQFDDDHGPIWFFTAKDNGIVRALGSGKGTRAIATYSSSGQDLFASITGRYTVDNDPAVIDRLWNSEIAAWYKGGKTDPKLALLRLDAEQAEIWLDGSSVVAGIKMLFGADPKKEFKDNVAKVAL